MSIKRRIFRQGNSLVISLPAYLLAEVGASCGDYLTLDQVNGKFIMMALSVDVDQGDEEEHRVRHPPEAV